MSEEAVTTTTKTLPVLPLKNTVLFPFFSCRSRSVAAPRSPLCRLLSARKTKKLFLTQKDPAVEVPGKEDLYEIGTKAVIRKMARPNENLMEVLVLGADRVTIKSAAQTEGYLQAEVEMLPLPEGTNAEVEALHSSIVDLDQSYRTGAASGAAQDSRRLASSAIHFPLAYRWFRSGARICRRAAARSQHPVDALRLMH